MGDSKNWQHKHRFVIFGIIIIALVATSYFVINGADNTQDHKQELQQHRQLSQSEKTPEKHDQEKESSPSSSPEVASSGVLSSHEQISTENASTARNVRPEPSDTLVDFPSSQQQQKPDTLASAVNAPIPLNTNSVQVPSGAQIPQNEKFAAELEVWQQFKTRYNKVYSSSSEELMRSAIFNENLKFISEFNEKQKVQFRLGVNKFADMRREEINRLYFGAPTRLSSMQTPPPLFILKEESSGPKEVDWRNLTYGPVDQGSCRDSAIFAAVATIESAFNRKFLPPINIKLSEMQVIDCMMQQPGSQEVCSGYTSMVQVFDLLQRNLYSLTVPEIYKMQSDNGIKCQISQETSGLPVAKLGGYMSINHNNILEALFNSGPLCVAIDASQSTFHFYQSGLYHDENCSTETYNHHAVLVGYSSATDNNPNQPYYLLRNSFGTQWGESGYMRLLKNEQINKCLPQNLAIFPSIAG